MTILIMRHCLTCGKPFHVPHHKIKNGRNTFCSLPCIRWPKQSIEDRFFRYIGTITNTGCILWKGARDRDGYGQLDNKKAPRVSYELLVGPIPDGMLICHTCDNPPCINPAHLFPGTQKRNSADMVAKGRQINGERHHSARLTEAIVRDIRNRFAIGKPSPTDVAKEFGVTPHAIVCIVSRLTWKHIA